MATTTVSSSSEVTSQSLVLRAELKEWERAFSAANGGRKADRNDIKSDPSIAAKYKEYGRLKSLESSSNKNKTSDSTKVDHESKKRKHNSSTGPRKTDPAPTPRKAAKHTFTTPSANRVWDTHPADIDPYDSPSVLRRLFSPSTHRTPLKTAIGPTPQRDGKTLGLFDLLSESGGSTATPSASRMANMRSATVQTPSKRNVMDTITEEEEETMKPERTPASSGKRFMLSNLFATPTTLRYAAMAEGPDNAKAAENGNQLGGKAAEESAVSGTPSFLRRSNPGRYGNGTAGGLSPTAVRKPQPFVGKGLSALVQGLRDMEEERLQDDMDVLHEIEAEQTAANVEVNDSQAQANDAGPRPKKKGQKRTTRRVIMRPVVVPRPTRASQSKEMDNRSDNCEEKDEDAAVPETQHPNAAPHAEAEGQHDDMDDAASLNTISEPDVGSDSDLDYTEEPEVSIPRSKSFSEKMKEAISSVAKQPPKPQEKPSVPKATKEKENQKPRARKVNPEAHANYRALKIRNKGTKGRFAGRFGRR
ncbi:DNA replication regulator sld2 [Aspergillus sclerotialis]|uniref:DNA replication regulator SLD2 n=1 Tax=Aspergillus sclerotialis TaxID=2070753 RepID=A0A3A2ZVK4_9EURO|nr:DNA replication regulator sld2 [Aspergillus sclerotialis]